MSAAAVEAQRREVLRYDSWPARSLTTIGRVHVGALKGKSLGREVRGFEGVRHAARLLAEAVPSVQARPVRHSSTSLSVIQKLSLPWTVTASL